MKKHREFYAMLCQNIKDELKRKKDGLQTGSAAYRYVYGAFLQ